MDDNGQHVGVFFLSPFLDYTHDQLGPKRVASILEEMGTTEAEMTDPSNWVSLSFVERFAAVLDREHDDPALFDHCGRLAFDQRYMGMMRPILSAFGSPSFAYDAMCKSLPRFNKVGQIEVTERGPGLRVMEYRPVEGMPRETMPQICAARRGQMAAIPTLFGLPPANVEHPLCMQRGDDCCRYETRWKEPGKGPWRWLLLAGGAAAGGGIATLAGAPLFWAGVTGAIGAGVGIGAATLASLRRSLGDRVEELAQHNEALLRSAQVNERRLAQVSRAKASVDQKVEERTAELVVTSERLAETLQQVRELNQSRTDFFANVSHDLRTPLQLIVGPLETMVARKQGGRATGSHPEGGQAGEAEIMLRNAHRLLHLIDQLLLVSRADAGPAQLRRIPMDPAALVRQVAEAFSLAARDKKVTLKVHGSERGTTTHLDPGWINSALSNLVGNALRHTPAGGEIELRYADQDDALRLEVRDTGPGIAPEKQATIFDRYAQGGGGGAMGLGLAIVQEAARLHGGAARVQSEPGEGARFTLSIPHWVPDSGEETPAVEDQELPRVSPVNAEPVEDTADELSGPNPDAPLALVVEDNADLRRYVGELLASRCRVISAADGEQALALCAERLPDIVVSDVAMPRMDGIELCRALKEEDRTRAVPVILLTARQATESVLSGYEAGAVDYVRKPFHARELMARVEVQLRLRAMVHEAAHRERLASLGVLAAEVAHHIRNPLNVIKNGLPVIEGKLTEEAEQGPGAELFQVINDSAGRIDTLVRDLLSLSGGDRTHPSRFKAAECLSSVLNLIKATLPRGVELKSSVLEEAWVFGWTRDLSYVFLNLLDNARQAVGEKGEITVNLAQEEDRVIFTVEDDGPGVPPEVADDIFAPFVTTRDAGQGTGLGLSIANKAAALHGGTLALESSALGGAKFVLKIPAADSEAN